MTISMLGIDIAKSAFQLHGVDNTGIAILKKRLPRHKLAAYVANIPPLHNRDGIVRWCQLLGASFPAQWLLGEADQPSVCKAFC